MIRRLSLWTAPCVIDETDTYAVVYKPPLMFSAPLAAGPAGTLLGWFAGRCPSVLEAGGAHNREGGLLHRLDFQTEGLVLFAKTREAFISLRAQQAAGTFVKEYSALTCTPPPDPAGNFPWAPVGLPGFPPPPLTGTDLSLLSLPASIESFFRPWGPGRKAVRPAQSPNRSSAFGKKRGIAGDRGGPYRTELLAAAPLRQEKLMSINIIREPGCPGPRELPRVLTLRIYRGFRHQIRCHLAWIGEPILNDVLYGGKRCPADRPVPGRDGAAGPDEKRPIALRARGFSFFNPSTGKQQSYRLPGFAETPGSTGGPSLITV
jgi:23S rRNA pseudouridine1911/1915/1917 synthase